MMRYRLALLTLLLISLLTFIFPVAAQSQTTVYATAQRFERGLMIWRSDTATIWVLTSNGQAFTFPSASYSHFPDNPIFGSPPSRLRPIWGFGRIWGNDPAIREALGWPTLPEMGFDMTIRTSGNTVYLTQFDGTIYQINPDNTWTFATQPPPSTPYVLNFTASPNPVLPGGTVTVTWTVQGTQFALLQVYDVRLNEFGGSDLLTSIDRLPLTGSTQVQIPQAATSGVILKIWGVNQARFWSSTSLYEWVVQASINLSVAGGAETTVTTGAAFQQYQNGFMIWRADTGHIYVFSGVTGGTLNGWPQTTYEFLPDNPFYDVPEGRVRPINGFGRVWGSSPNIRSILGWATGVEHSYQTTIHTVPGVEVTITLPDQRAAHVKQSWWSFAQ